MNRVSSHPMDVLGSAGWQRFSRALMRSGSPSKKARRASPASTRVRVLQNADSQGQRSGREPLAGAGNVVRFAVLKPLHYPTAPADGFVLPSDSHM